MGKLSDLLQLSQPAGVELRFGPRHLGFRGCIAPVHKASKKSVPGYGADSGLEEGCEDPGHQ